MTVIFAELTILSPNIKTPLGPTLTRLPGPNLTLPQICIVPETSQMGRS